MGVKGSCGIRISAPGQYEGYSEKNYDDSLRKSFYFTASDGTKLAVDVYLPVKNGLPETQPVPFLFHYTPYGRVISSEEAHEAYGLPDDGKLYFDDWGIEGMMDLLDYGYGICIAEVRGTGASYGARLTTNSRREARDGKEIIEWLAGQPYCNGKVAMAGYSYTGQTQLECLSMQPKGLVACFLCMTDYDKYDGWMRGGIPRAFGTQPDTDFGSTEEETRAVVERIAARVVPVDDDPDKVQLREAIYQHKDSGSQIHFQRDLNWRDSYLEASGGPHWKVIGASTYKDEINAQNAACYLVGGVYDVFRRDTFIMYSNMTCPKKLLMGPWYHMDPKADVRWDIEMRRWFDYWLKGIDNGIMTEAPVIYKECCYNFDRRCVAGAGTGSYIERESWPVHAGRRETWYADAAGAAVTPYLPAAAQVDFSDAYGPVTSVESKETTHDSGSGMDQQGLVFTSAPLQADKVITGHPMSRVTFSLEDPGWQKDQYDCDIFVNLIDVDPVTGRSFLITTGQLRASQREQSEPTYDFLGLPWHRCNTGDNRYLELGVPYTLMIDLLPTSYRVKQGHMLRVTITNSMDRMYYLGRSAYEENPDCAKPRIRVYTGGKDPTCVILPDIYNE